jgi:hypothetical protein
MRLVPCGIPLPLSMRVFLNLPSQRSPCVRKAAQARTGFGSVAASAAKLSAALLRQSSAFIIATISLRHRLLTQRDE